MKFEHIKNLLSEVVTTGSGQIAKVVRHGKVVKRRICPPGYKLEDGVCRIMSASEKRARSRGAVSANRKSTWKRIKSRRKSMNVRKKRNI